MERWGAEQEASNSQQGQQVSGKTRHLGQFQEPGNGRNREDSRESNLGYPVSKAQETCDYFSLSVCSSVEETQVYQYVEEC